MDDQHIKHLEKVLQELNDGRELTWSVADRRAVAELLSQMYQSRVKDETENLARVNALKPDGFSSV